MDFWRGVNVLYKRKWLILLTVVLAVGLTYGATRLIGARWSGTVRLRTPANELQALADASGQRRQQSRRFDARRESQKWLLRATSPSVTQPALAKVGRSLDPSRVTKQIAVKAMEGGYVDVTVQGPSPVYVRRFANALADAMDEAYQSEGSLQARYLVKALDGRLTAARIELAKSRRALDNFRARNDVVVGVSDTLTPVFNRLNSALSGRDELEARLAEVQSRLQMARTELATLPETVPVEDTPSDSPLVAQLRQQLAGLESQLVTLQARYTNEHIEVKRVLAQRDAAQARLDEELAKTPTVVAQRTNPQRALTLATIASLESNRKSVQALLRATKAQIEQLQGRLGRYRGLDTQLAPLVHAVTVDEERVSSIEQRLKDARLNELQAQSAHRLVLEAPVGKDNPPINETEGRTKKLLILALLGSLMGTAALIIGLDSVDQRVKTVVEAEEALALPVRAAIPRAIAARDAGELARTTELEPRSLQSEAYHFLGLHLILPGQRPVQSVMVMSAKAEQGTTSTICNLAITLAQAGRRVVLVDANLRNPAVHEVFGLSSEVGLTSVLADPRADLAGALQNTEVENLRVLAAGPPNDNPWQLMRSRSMEDLATQLRAIADFVLYDTPSALAFTDAFNLAPAVDGAFVVVRALEAPTGSERRLLELLKMAHVEVLGSVLHSVPVSLLDSHSHYHHYYPATERPLPALVGGGSSDSNPPAPLGDGHSLSGNGTSGNGASGNGSQDGADSSDGDLA